MLTFLLNGGLFMIPLVTCAILAISVIIERGVVLKEVKAFVRPFLDQFNRLIGGGDLAGAKDLCAETPHPVSRMLAAGLARRDEVKQEVNVSFIHDQIDTAVSDAGGEAISMLEKRLSLLAIISNLAPLFGFAGTVTGMIMAFGAIAGAGDVQVEYVARGISEALNTTATGLMIGIVATVGYSYYTNKIGEFVGQLEETSNGMLSRIVKDIIAERYGEEDPGVPEE